MRDIDRVCVSCGKIDLGNGVWSDIDSQSKRKKEKAFTQIAVSTDSPSCTTIINQTIAANFFYLDCR